LKALIDAGRVLQTSELLLGSREMTASEALNCGLVTRTLWHDRFLEELVPLVKTFASQSAQVRQLSSALRVPSATQKVLLARIHSVRKCNLSRGWK